MLVVVFWCCQVCVDFVEVIDQLCGVFDGIYFLWCVG